MQSNSEITMIDFSGMQENQIARGLNSYLISVKENIDPDYDKMR